jgi:uncharacterized membrane protein
MNKSVFGLDENVAAALAYLFTILSGLVILIMEKENKFVRFHAMQSVLLGVLVAILSIALSILSGIPLIGFIAALADKLLYFAALAVSILLIIKAYSKDAYKLPIIGDVAAGQVGA